MLRDEAMSCSEMDGSLMIKGDAAPTGATIFSNEACDGVQAMGDYVPSSLTIPQVDLQDIKSYFQRPRLILRGSAILGSRNVLTNYSLSIANIATAFPQWVQRTSGAYAVRFTAVFRVQVAATAFHQGLFCVAFQYGPGAIVNTTADFPRQLDPTFATNLPHVRLDLSQNTMVELKVPFLYPLEFVPVSGVDDYNGYIGGMSLTTLLPIISVAGLSTPTYEVYLTLEDIEFFGVNNPTVTTVTLQSGSFSAADELRKTKLVSKTLDNMGKISSFVARRVPLLSAVAGPTAWFLDQAAGVARYFGFSRPLIQDPIVRVVRQPYVGEGQVDIPFAGFTVGGFQSNTLALTPDIGATEVDEMALSFVTSQWSQINVGSVSTSNSHGTVVYATPLSLSSFWFRAGTTPPYCNKTLPASSSSVSGNTIYPSTLMYISSFFRLWRGTIHFRVTFAKTKFHGGRYMIYYDPSSTINNNRADYTTVEGPEVASSLTQPYGYSKICDLKDDNVFEFSVPYVNEKPYTTFFSRTGGLTITCIDPLQSSASVSPTVPFMVEVRGGPDFELADYTGSYLKPWPNSLVTVLQQSQDFTKLKDHGPADLDPIVYTATKDPSQIAMGEKYLSIKQLIQIPTYVANTLAGSATSATSIPPWFYCNSSAAYGAPTTPAAAGLVHIGTDHSPPALAQLYNFARGSTDFHMYTQGSVVSASCDQLPMIGSSDAFTALTDYGRHTNIASSPKVLTVGEAPLHVRLPAFQTQVRIPVSAFAGTNFTRTLGSTPNSFSTVIGHFARFKVQNSSATTQVVNLGYSAGDDATLASFRGPPPVLVPNPTATNPLNPSFS